MILTVRLALVLAAPLAFAAPLTLAAAAPEGAEAAKGFRFGVAAGEVRANSARIWARPNRSGPTSAEVATDRRFRNVVASLTRGARERRDQTVQAVVRGLQPNRVHHYRWCIERRKGQICARGRFHTAPRAAESRAISFAFTGDSDGTRLPGARQPFFGSFDVFDAMRREGNHFNVHLGDTMYSDTGVGNQRPALSVKAKWRKYKENLRVANMRAIRSSGAVYNHWDDHEFINDFSIPEFGQVLYRRGVKAFRNYMPVTFTRRDGIYRSFRWGSNLELFFLDQRSFRSAKASAGPTCDNPQTGEPDLAPTAPQSARNTFSALIPSLSQPVSEACKARINDPGRTMLGERQRTRFLREVARSNASWKVVMNETPMQQFYGLPYDRWEGYAFERLMLLNELEQRGISGVVFLSTDTHAAFANVVRKRTLEDDVAPANAPPGAPVDTAYEDFVSGPVATNTFWASIDTVTGNEGNGELLSNAFFKPPPPDGVGMRCAQGGAYNYAQVRVTPQQLIVTYKDENGNQLLDVNGEPCGPYVLGQ